MSVPSGFDGPGSVPPGFACEWSAVGGDSAVVRIAGELDTATVPEVDQALREALRNARLVMVDVQAVVFVDSSALPVLLDGAQRARRAGSRLVLVGASADLERLFWLTGTQALLDRLPGPRTSAGVRGDAGRMPRGAPAEVRSAQPVNGEAKLFKNPVNARIVMARVMDIPDRGLWAHCPDGAIRRGWAPESVVVRVPAGGQVELFIDRDGAVNGWWHADSRLAINQRHLHATDAGPLRAAALACQGSCGLLWQAPAAERMLEHDERCLTCAGALVPV